MIEIEKPRIESLHPSADGSYGKFVVEPLERGYGTTLGNSLRRVLLSSLPGVAVTSVKIEGVSESITTIPPEYLLVPTIWVNSDGTKYLSCTVDQLNQCFEAGIMPLMRYTDDGYTYCCQVAGRMDDKFGFTFAEDVVLHVSYADGTVTEGGGK